MAFASALLFICHSSFSQPYFPIKVNDHWGLINIYGKVVIKPDWTYVPFEVSPGKFFVHDTATYTDIIIDKYNRFVDSVDYDESVPYSEKDGPGWIPGEGYTNKYGKIFIKDTFVKSFPYENGLARVVTKGEYPQYNWDDAAGYIDRTGKFVIPPVYDEYGLDDYFQDGYVRFESGVYEGFLDTKGDTVIPPIYDRIRDFSEGMAAVDIDNKWNFIDRKGNILLKEWYDDVHDFSNGMAVVNNWSDQSPITYVNLKGESLQLDTAIFENIDAYANDFNEGLAVAELKNGKDVYIDKTGKIILQGDFWSAGKFSEGMAQVWDTVGVYFIDKTGKKISQYFDDADDFKNGLAAVFTGEDVGLMGTGCVVALTSYRFHSSSLFTGDLKMGYINKQGVVVWKPTR